MDEQERIDKLEGELQDLMYRIDQLSVTNTKLHDDLDAERKAHASTKDKLWNEQVRAGRYETAFALIMENLKKGKNVDYTV